MSVSIGVLQAKSGFFRPRLYIVWLAAAMLTVGWPLGADAAEDVVEAERPAASSQAVGDPIALINRHIRQGWEDNGYSPSKEAQAGEWCRRVYLDLIGRIPSVKELRSYLASRKEGKKARLVDRLLGDEYHDEFARHWTTLWTNIFIGRTGGTEPRSLTSRAGMKEYVRECFEYDKSYDRIVAELITASGSTTPGAENFNGATNFLAMKLADDGVQATAKTAQIFLGLQVQCTQCHNHPFNEQKQNQFWEMNAFFRQTRALRRFDDREIVNVELVDEGFRGEGSDPSEAELYYELRNGKLKVAYPVFVDGTSLVDIKGEEIGNSGYLEDVNRRQELAKLVLESRHMDQAIANRMWAHFLGYGLTKPIDDMGPHNPPTHPELLDELGLAFRESGFHLKDLMRWIVLSKPYGLSSRTTRKNKDDDPTLGRRPMFSHFYLRQMQAEQLYESLLVATRADETWADDPAEHEARRTRWLSQFASAFGTDENDESTSFDGTIPQTLMMMNGELVRQATSDTPGSFLYQVATNGELSNAQRISYLYEAALSRRPVGREKEIANRLLALRDGNVGQSLQDVWWALLNSNEFILIH